MTTLLITTTPASRWRGKQPSTQKPPSQKKSGGVSHAAKPQIDNIKQLQSHSSLSGDFVQYITDRLNTGLTKEQAFDLINEIEAKIEETTPEVLK